MVRGVLFGLDDTLIDRVGSLRRYARDFWTEFRDAMGLDQEAFVRRFLDLAGHGCTPRARFFAALAAELPGGPGEEQVRKHFLRHAWEQPILVKGALAGLQQLKDRGFAVGVVTNGTRDIQQTKLANSGLLDVLDGWVVEDEVGTRKPDPVIFRQACRVLSLDPSHGWVIGAHPVQDVWGGSRAGLRAIWLQRYLPWPPDLPRCHVLAVHHLGQALRFLR